MPIIASSRQESTFEPLAAGSYPARIYQIIHIGHIEKEWMGETKTVNAVRISFEFPTETKVFKEENGEQPYVLSQEYTLSMGEKANLRKTVEGLKGRQLTDQECMEFDVEGLMGESCLVNVVHRQNGDRTYANIASVSPLPKGLSCPPPVNEPTMLSYDAFDRSLFESLPQFVREKIESSEEYTELTERKAKAKPIAEDAEINIDDIPF